MAKQTRADVFHALQTNARYVQLHKAKDEVEKALKHARGSRLPASVTKNLGRSFDGIVKQMISIEDAALKKAGH